MSFVHDAVQMMKESFLKDGRQTDPLAQAVARQREAVTKIVQGEKVFLGTEDNAKVSNALLTLLSLFAGIFLKEMEGQSPEKMGFQLVCLLQVMLMTGYFEGLGEAERLHPGAVQ